MCPASRTLLAAAVAGMVASSILANDTIGWIVAFAVGVVVHLVQRRRPALATCALPRDSCHLDRRPARKRPAVSCSLRRRATDDCHGTDDRGGEVTGSAGCRSGPGEDDLQGAGVGGVGEHVVGLVELVEGEVVGDEPGGVDLVALRPGAAASGSSRCRPGRS